MSAIAWSPGFVKHKKTALCPFVFSALRLPAFCSMHCTCCRHLVVVGSGEFVASGVNQESDLRYILLGSDKWRSISLKIWWKYSKVVCMQPSPSRSTCRGQFSRSFQRSSLNHMERRADLQGQPDCCEHSGCWAVTADGRMYVLLGAQAQEVCDTACSSPLRSLSLTHFKW